MNVKEIDISKLPADVRRTYKQLKVLHAEKKIQNKARNDFLSFVKYMWPEFVEGSHHRHIAEKFNKLATGELTCHQDTQSLSLHLSFCHRGWWAVIQNLRLYKPRTIQN